ncbi:MAG: VOC family protein [Bacteroidota bacterium]
MKVRIILICVLLCGHEYVVSQNHLKFHGLRVFVNSLESSLDFYQGTLGFEVKDKNESEVVLKTGSWPIYLQKSNSQTTSDYPKVARTGLAIQTAKLLPRIDHFREQGIPFFDSLLQRNGVGISIPFEDPSGNVLNLIEVQIRQVPTFQGLKIYNTGVTISNMETATQFYEDILGFEEWSRAYLPAALPLKHADGSFAFMIHCKEGLTDSQRDYGTSPQMVLMFSTSDMATIKRHLQNNEVVFKDLTDSIICQDPAGNFIEIIETSNSVDSE